MEVKTSDKTTFLQGALNRIQQLLALKKNKTHYADCVIRNEKGEFLLLHRSYQDDLAPGKWCLPGGHIEDGEEPMIAAGRELEEETGYKDVPLFYLDKADRKDSVSLYYEGFVYSGTPTLLDNDEHYRIQWVKPEDLDDYELLFDLKEILAKLPLSPTPTMPEVAPIGEDLYTSWQNNLTSFNEGKVDESVFFKTVEIHKAVAAYELVCRAFDNDEITPEQFSKVHKVEKAEGFNQALELAKGTDTEVLEEIVKGGEGSRGGKIIGHTSTGKAVYQMHKKFGESIYKKDQNPHNDFTKEEHEEAAKLHDRFGSTISSKKLGLKISNNIADSAWHSSQARKLREIEKMDTGSVPGAETVTENGKLVKSEKIKGGLADNKTLKDVATHHKVELKSLRKEFIMGLEVEMEHTDDEEAAEEIAKDHLWEDPNYYTKLKKVEK